jgi:small subunit ribosomal protein S6
LPFDPTSANGAALHRFGAGEKEGRRGVPHGAASAIGMRKVSNMAHYEHVFLARQDLAQAQVDALAMTAHEIIQSNGGKVVKTETWGLRSLAYKIAKNRKAHYVMLEFDAPGTVVAELERQTQINEDIIRYMTTKVDAHEAGPSVMMRKSVDRGDRERKPRRDRDDDFGSDY